MLLRNTKASVDKIKSCFVVLRSRISFNLHLLHRGDVTLNPGFLYYEGGVDDGFLVEFTHKESNWTSGDEHLRVWNEIIFSDYVCFPHRRLKHFICASYWAVVTETSDCAVTRILVHSFGFSTDSLYYLLWFSVTFFLLYIYFMYISCFCTNKPALSDEIITGIQRIVFFCVLNQQISCFLQQTSLEWLLLMAKDVCWSVKRPFQISYLLLTIRLY